MSPPRRAIAALAAVVVVVLAVLVLRGANDQRPLLGNLGILNKEPVAFLDPGFTACQGALQVAPGTTAVTWVLNTRRRPGPPLRFEARDPRTHRVLAAAAVQGGYGDGPKTMSIEGLPSTRLVDLCLINRGRSPVDVYGDQSGRFRNSTSSIRATKQTSDGDAYLTWQGARGATVLQRLGAAADHAAVWLPRPLGVWTVWGLVGSFVFGVPLLLAVALRRAVSRT